MISYFKTQWFNLVLGFCYIGISIVNFCREGDELWGVAWMISAVLMFVMSSVNHNNERIKLLEKKAEKYDAICEEVHALYESNRISSEFNNHLKSKIDSLIHIVEECRYGN
jgi:hypothetical protein